MMDDVRKEPEGTLKIFASTPAAPAAPAAPVQSPAAPASRPVQSTVKIFESAPSEKVQAAMQEFGAVYFGAVGGAAALIARCIQKSEVVAYSDLGPEAIHRFTVECFPVLVLMDAHGGNLYETGPALYKSEIL